MQLSKTTAFLLLCCSLSHLPLLAQQAGVVLHTSGQVTVNGNPVTNSTALFPGDKVQSGANASADIAASGASVTMAASSSLIWQPQAIQFQDGSVTVVAQAPWQVHIDAMTVTLGAELAKVEVTQREGVALIKLLSGSATLSEGGQATALKVDFTVARPRAGNAPAPVVAAKHGSHTGVILVVAGAAAAAGIGLGARGSGNASTPAPISPSVP